MSVDRSVRHQGEKHKKEREYKKKKNETKPPPWCVRAHPPGEPPQGPSLFRVPKITLVFCSKPPFKKRASGLFLQILGTLMGPHLNGDSPFLFLVQKRGFPPPLSRPRFFLDPFQWGKTMVNRNHSPKGAPIKKRGLKGS